MGKRYFEESELIINPDGSVFHLHDYRFVECNTITCNRNIWYTLAKVKRLKI